MTEQELKDLEELLYSVMSEHQTMSEVRLRFNLGRMSGTVMMLLAEVKRLRVLNTRLTVAIAHVNEELSEGQAVACLDMDRVEFRVLVDEHRKNAEDFYQKWRSATAAIGR